MLLLLLLLLLPARYQSPWGGQPVVSLALGQMPLPHKAALNPACTTGATAAAAAAAAAAAGPGQLGKAPSCSSVRALVAVAADGQLAVMDAATGFLLAR